MAAAMLLSSCAADTGYVTITGYAQGGTYSVKLNLSDPDGGVLAEPENVKAAIDSILTVIDNSVSGYNKSSILSRFNAGERVAPDHVFIDLYEISRRFYDQTDGAFDVAAAPLFDIWGFGFTPQQLPSDEAVDSVLSVSGMDRLCDDIVPFIAADGTLAARDIITDGRPELPKLNFNAVAQGYSCDRIAEYLHSLGVSDMLVEIGGGEIFSEGVNPFGRNWTIGIDRPVDGNMEKGKEIQAVFESDARPKGIVTSGNYRKFYVKDGKKFSHTIDPRNGYPVEHALLSATVLAPDSSTADALATYCMVIGLDEAKEFISSTEGLEACLVWADGDSFSCWTSEGFSLRQ